MAEVNRVVVEELGPHGTFGGRQYTWVTAAMGEPSPGMTGLAGTTRVPVHSRIPTVMLTALGFVDVVNSADFSNYLDENVPFGKRKIYYTGDVFHSDYLRWEGFTDPSVQSLTT